MSRFQPKNLSTRIVLVALLATLAALALALVVLSVLEVIRFREDTLRRLQSLNAVLNKNCAVALAFDYADEAGKILGSLEAEPDIQSAAIYVPDGRQYAALSFRNFPPPEAHLNEVTSRGSIFENLVLESPLILDGQKYGTLRLRAAGSDLGSKLARYLGTMGLLALLSFLLAAFVARRLQATISEPLRELVAVTRESARGGPLRRVRAPLAQDEVAELVVAFNRMADEIERREQALAESNQMLETRVQQRTRELAQAITQAQGARQQAERASDDKTRFLNTMSHELRTPLTAIIGYTRLLSEELGDNDLAAAQRDIATVEFSARHLLGLISNVLDHSKIEAGKMELQLETFDPIPVLQDCAKMFTPLFTDKQNVLVLDFHFKPGSLTTDRAKLRQILFNLLSNAAKFTHAGRITLRTLQQGNSLEILVEDTGSGMDEDQLRRAFEPFQSGVDGKPSEGTGLGLALVQMFCVMLNGSFDLQSRAGQGTSCRVRLPLLNPPPA